MGCYVKLQLIVKIFSAKFSTKFQLDFRKNRLFVLKNSLSQLINEFYLSYNEYWFHTALIVFIVEFYNQLLQLLQNFIDHGF